MKTIKALSPRWLLVAIGLWILSCESIDEDANMQQPSPEPEVAQTEIIDFKGLSVKHRFRTPAKELTIEMSTTGLKKMFTGIKKTRGTLQKTANSEILYDLPDDALIIEATKEIAGQFPYDFEKEPLLERSELQKLLDTLPVELKTFLYQNNLIDFSEDLKRQEAHEAEIRKIKEEKERKFVAMIQNDFYQLSEEEIATHIELIDEYYKKNMNYEILLTAENKKTELALKAAKSRTASKVNYDRDDAQCVANTTGTLANLLTIINAAQDAERIADENFPNMDPGDTRRDAMRHIMWNVLLAKYYATLSSARSTRIDFAKRITDAHEDCSSTNTEAAKAMDLHNNAIGRYVYGDNTGTRKFLGMTYAVDEAPTYTYMNDALDRIQNRSCFIVKEYDPNSYPEKLLDNIDKLDTEVRQQIVETDHNTVVYFKGPVANGSNRDIVTDLYDFSSCTEEDRPWMTTMYFTFRKNHIWYSMNPEFYDQYYDPDTDTYIVPFSWPVNLCVQHVHVKCYRL